MCGESTDFNTGEDTTTGWPWQRGWVIKVDEYGCLVEGCQLADNINVTEQNQEIEYFKAGPIPVGQFLNIYQSVTADLSTYQLINYYGQVVEEFSSMSKGTTMMLDVSKYTFGNYLLVLMDGNEVLQRTKVIIH